MIFFISLIIFSLLSDSWLGAEQRAQGAYPEAGVGLVGWSSGHKHAAGGSDTCGARGAARVSP